MRTSAGYARYLVALVCALILFQAGVSQLPVLAAGPTGTPAPGSPPASIDPAQPSAPPASPGPAQSPLPSPTASPSTEPPIDPGTELVDRRTAYSQTFAQADGTWRVEEFADPIFYQPDGASDWQPIDLSFGRPVADGATTSVASSPSRISLFPANSATGFLRLEGSGQSISFGVAQGTQPGADHATAQILDNGAYAEYADFLPGGIGLRVFPHADGFKSFLVIPARPASNVFSLSINTALAIVDEGDGSYTFRDAKGNIAGRLPRPFLVDSSDVEGRGGGLYAEAVTQAVAGDGQLKTLTLTVDPAFLDQAVYPVYIDPTVTTFPTGSTTANDTFSSSKYPGSNFNTYQRPNSPFYNEMWHGNEPGTSYYNHVFIRFNDLEINARQHARRLGLAAALPVLAIHPLDAQGELGRARQRGLGGRDAHVERRACDRPDHPDRHDQGRRLLGLRRHVRHPGRGQRCLSQQRLHDPCRQPRPGRLEALRQPQRLIELQAQAGRHGHALRDAGGLLPQQRERRDLDPHAELDSAGWVSPGRLRHPDRYGQHLRLTRLGLRHSRLDRHLGHDRQLVRHQRRHDLLLAGQGQVRQ